MSINATGIVLLALMYFVAGQAIAHPIFVAASEQMRNNTAFRNRLGITFGLLWPIAYPAYVLTFKAIQRRQKDKKTPADDAFDRIERERREEHANRNQEQTNERKERNGRE